MLPFYHKQKKQNKTKKTQTFQQMGKKHSESLDNPQPLCDQQGLP